MTMPLHIVLKWFADSSCSSRFLGWTGYPRSRDLTPIEHLLDTLGREGGRVQDNHPSPANVGELFQFLQQKWKANP